MARKKKPEEHENHERWLVSYADFITLLFAFFVVMYSVSSVNEGKYRVLSESLEAAFRAPARSLAPIQIGAISKTSYGPQVIQKQLPIFLDMPGLPPPSVIVKKQSKGEKAKGKGAGKALDKVSDEIMHAMSSLIDQGLIKVKGNELQVEVEINTEILFGSGSAVLARAAIPMLELLATVLTPFANDVLVEGYTDNIPIKSGKYPSNWELSASRAASVVHLFSSSGIDPKRMAAIGYGEHRPIATNETIEGRTMNRRVVLVIPAVKPGSETHKALSDAKILGTGRSSEIKGWVPLQDVTPGRDLSLSEFDTVPPETTTFGKDRGLIADIEINLGSSPGMDNDNIVTPDSKVMSMPGTLPHMLPPTRMFDIPGVHIDPITGGSGDVGLAPGSKPSFIDMPIKSPITIGLPKRKTTKKLLDPAVKTGDQNKQKVDEAKPVVKTQTRRYFKVPEPMPAPDMTMQRDLSLTADVEPTVELGEGRAGASINKSNAASKSSGKKRSAPIKQGNKPAFNIIPPPITFPSGVPGSAPGSEEGAR